MILSGDFELFYPLWDKAQIELCSSDKIGLFRRFIDLYIVACAIGIHDDSVKVDFEEKLDSPKMFGSKTYLSMDNNDLQAALEFMLKTAILTTKTIDIDNEERIKLAFDPEYENKKIGNASKFLNGFANYGLDKIYSVIEETDSMANIDNIYGLLQKNAEANYDSILDMITLEEIIK